ncbi:hypothetical protein PIB30_028216 [Stylosanthes scabra]|uniref:Uncharacterized protein n=1 Tax=Stylosanthes scabra TaxID=79078 RepID=A0ABU6TB43_9FABA|nr:hypothetical protein [Stylosanthes scabra]
MGSEIIYNEIEKREKYEDSNEKANSYLAVVKIDVTTLTTIALFIHSISSGLIPIVRMSFRPITRLGTPSSSPKMDSSPRGQLGQRLVRPLKSWELIPLSEGWKCERDWVEKEVSKDKALAMLAEAKVDDNGDNGKEDDEEEEDSE